jgi:hypothetical protein
MVAPTDGWIGVDFDGTLADYSQGWQGAAVLGKPVLAMLERVKRWIGEGREVRIFTARVWPLNDIPVDLKLSMHVIAAGSKRDYDAAIAAAAIRVWCQEHLGVVLHITNIKDLRMVELYDDRCVQVIANTGQLVGGSSRGVSA